MKKKILVLLFVCAVISISTLTVFGVYYSTEADLLNYLSRSTTICQNWSLTNQSTYSGKTITGSHLGTLMYCTQNGSQAKTQILYDWGAGSNCYCETYVYNNSGVLVGNAHKSGSKATVSATATVNVSSINVKSVLHVGYQPQGCNIGEHCFLLFK